MKTLRIKTLAARHGGLADDGGEVMYRTYEPWLGDGSGSGPCTISSCTTTLTGPMGVECCCFYSCPSGSLWRCTQGRYCAA